jgi:hypothetical protein
MLTTSRDIVPLNEILELFSPTCTLAHLLHTVHLTGLFHLHVHANNSLADTLPQTFRIYPVLSAYSTAVQYLHNPYFTRCTQKTMLFRNIGKSLATPFYPTYQSLTAWFPKKNQSARKKKTAKFSLFRIRDIMVRIRMRMLIPGSVPVPNGSGLQILLFSSVAFKTPTKIIFLSLSFYAYSFLKVHLHHCSKTKSH